MILVDPRAGSGPLVKPTPHPALRDIAVAADPQLESGDASFLGHGPTECPIVSVGVEIKTVSELVGSLLNGRANGIDGQFRQLAAAYDVRWLVFYGPVRPNPDTGALQIGATWAQKGYANRVTVEWWDFGAAHATSGFEGRYDGATGRASRGVRTLPYDYLAKFLASPSFTSLNISTWHCVDIDEVAAWLRALYEVWQKPWEQHRAMNTFDQSQLAAVKRPPTMKPPTKRELQVAVTASTLPGVGYERAWALAKVYGSNGGGGVRAMVNAGAAALAEVKVVDVASKRERRIGKVVAQAIEEAVT